MIKFEGEGVGRRKTESSKELYAKGYGSIAHEAKPNGLLTCGP